MNLVLLFTLLILTCLARGQFDLKIQNYQDFAVLTGKIWNIFDNAFNVELSSQIKLQTEDGQPTQNGKLQFKTKEKFFKNGKEQTTNAIPSQNLIPSGLHIKWAREPRIETFRKHITGNDMQQLVRLRRQTMNRPPTEVMARPSEQQSRRQQLLQRIFQLPTQEQTITGENNARTTIPQMLTNNGQNIGTPDQWILGQPEQFRRNIPQVPMQTSRFLGNGTSQQQAVRTPQQMVGTQGQPNTGLFLTKSEHPLAWTNRQQALRTPTGQMPMPGAPGQMVGRPGQLIARIPVQHTVQTPGHQILGSSTNGQQNLARASDMSNQRPTWPISFPTERSPAQRTPRRFQRPITRTSGQQVFRNPILQMIRNPNGQVVELLGQQLTGTLSQQARSLPNQPMNQSPGTHASFFPFSILRTQPISHIQQTRSMASPAFTGQGNMAVTLAGTQIANDPFRSASLDMIGLIPDRNGISAVGPIFTVLPSQDPGGDSILGSSRFSSSLDQGMQLPSPFPSGSSTRSQAIGMDIRNNLAIESSSVRPEFLQFLRRSRANMPIFDISLEEQNSIPQMPRIWPGEPLFSMIGMPPEGFSPVPGVQLGFGPGRPILHPFLDMSPERFGSLLGEPPRFRPW
ncbi:hypothetical protein CHS0354_020241 [Potamilus streckersoni]|uniref:Uncharacterized protein n=1 Tax=Potamilus streckersoni TaxID=2493646 RepID=A0AAE0VQV5_9BIVA|nr:hypothetical protein CHS0354_020241 [Potamilus streckersoni]